MTFARALWHTHRPLMMFTAAMFILAAVALTGLVFDDRTIGGAPIWAKPFKFAVSFIAYAVMWTWLLSLQTSWRRAGWWLGTVITAAAATEMVVITGQVIRGRHSHFNLHTPLDAALWQVMGIMIVLLFVASLVWAALLWREDIGDRSLTLSIRYGATLAVAGLALGGLMLFPTEAQRDARAAGSPTLFGAHNVGVTDGGAGLPLLGWSTEGGDLRIPHFVGMHALQLLPFLALALISLSSRVPALRDEWTRARIITVLAVSYAGLIAIVTWQALRGQALLRPDAATLAALALFVMATAAAITMALTRTPRTDLNHTRTEKAHA